MSKIWFQLKNDLPGQTPEYREGHAVRLLIAGRDDWYVWHRGYGGRGWALTHYRTGWLAAGAHDVARFTSGQRGNAWRAEKLAMVTEWLNGRLRPGTEETFWRRVDSLASMNPAEPPCAVPAAFEWAHARALEFEAREREAGTVLAAIPGVGSGSNGLTPDSVKASPEYQAARAAYDRAKADLQAFNAVYVKQHAKALRAARRARDAARSNASVSMGR